MTAPPYRLYYFEADDKKEPGPEFDSLDDALAAARSSKRRCDILCPNGEWYARQQTVGIDLRKEIDPEILRKIEQNADDVVERIRSRPSRNKPPSKH